jgi:hypothetical protein
MLQMMVCELSGEGEMHESHRVGSAH